MSLSQDERMRIQVEIMECRALAGLNEDDPVLKVMWDEHIKWWENLLEPTP